MIVNGVIISNDKNKNMLEKKIIKDLVYQMLKDHLDYQMLKKQMV